jgi:hypothetical protein
MPDPTAHYSIEVDSVEKAAWEKLLPEFEDAGVFQTWSWGAENCGERNLSFILLRREGEVLAMAQVRIKRLPLIRLGIATVFWGPLWRRRNATADRDVLDRMIEALRNEYVIKRRLLMRIWPVAYQDADDGTVSILEKHGFIRNSRIEPYRTLISSLSPPIAELRQNLDRKWRQALARGEKFPSLELESGTSNELYGIALNIYNEMHDRKQFDKAVDMEAQGRVQKDLPESLKMNIMICRLEGEPIAALGWSTIGDTGLPLIGAAGDKALSRSTNATNLLWWKMLEDMKNRGCKFCDVAGVDPVLNPGPFKFKLGFAGKSARDVTHVGQFFQAGDRLGYFLTTCLDRTAEIRAGLRRMFK